MSTVTGGSSWTQQTPPGGTSQLNSVSCPNTSQCFAVGVDSVLASSNAGHTWSTVPSPSDVSGLNGISCPTTSDCTAVGFGIFGSPVIIGTTDSGANWTTETVIPADVGDLTGVSCVSTSICQAVSDYDSNLGSPSIIATTNGGTTWSTEHIPGTATNFTAISCSDPMNCTAVGSSTTGPGVAILNTTDGGTVWTTQVPPSGVTSPGRHLLCHEHGLPRNGIKRDRHENGGTQWSDLGSPAGSTTLTSVSCFSESSCTAVGGTDILLTTDGGVNWTDQVVPSGVGSLLGVSCVGPANCEAAGVGTDFGATIETLSAPPSVTTTALNVGTIGVPYASSLGATAGSPPTRGPSPEELSLRACTSRQTEPSVALRPSPGSTRHLHGYRCESLSSATSLVIAIKPLAAPGYWLVASDGGIFSYGGAQFYGSTGSLHLNAPIISMAATPDDAGYWLLAPTEASSRSATPSSTGLPEGCTSTPRLWPWLPRPTEADTGSSLSDGGVFAFGDASFYGSAGSLTLDRPIVGMASTIDGLGYWLVASDGGIFDYGDAGFFGSTGGLPLHQPIVAMTSSPDGGGYWLVAADGGIFSFGDVNYFGSAGGMPLSAPIVGMDRTADGQGYWMVARDGGIFDYGDAGFYGSAGGLKLNRPVVGMAAIQSLGSWSGTIAVPVAGAAPVGATTLPQFVQQPTDETTEPGGTSPSSSGHGRSRPEDPVAGLVERRLDLSPISPERRH